jgi:hypothetical protein
MSADRVYTGTTTEGEEPQMTTIIPGTPEANQLGYSMLARELAFEIVTGMKRGRNYSPLALAKRLGFKGRLKIDALVWVIETFNVPPSGTVEKALAKHGLVAVPAE